MNEQAPAPRPSRWQMPHTLVVVAALILMVLVLSWLVPAGEFHRVDRLLPGGGRVRVPVPGTYTRLPKVWLGLGSVLKAPLRGFLDGGTLIGFLLIIGGSFQVFQETGAVDAGIRRLVGFLARKPALESLVIPLLMIVFSLAGATFGMAEEQIPFVVVFIALARGLGYDSIVGVCIPFLGAATGFACAFFNPFTVGIAQGIASVPMYSGLAYRMATWTVAMVVVIGFVMRYARKVKRNPEASLVHDVDLARGHGALDPDGAGPLGPRRALVLGIFFATLVLLVFGVVRYQWDMDALAALFLAMGIIIGLVAGQGPSLIASRFVAGAKDMVGVVMIVACARALLVIANDARIMDTMLLGGSWAIRLLPRALTAQVMFLVQCVINFFIHSGTAQAALTMPIMAPLADLVGVTRQTCVFSFTLSELINPILPTSAVTMGVLGAARIPWDRWARFFLPLMLMLMALACLFLVPPTLFFHWGP